LNLKKKKIKNFQIFYMNGFMANENFEIFDTENSFLHNPQEVNKRKAQNITVDSIISNETFPDKTIQQVNQTFRKELKRQSKQQSKNQKNNQQSQSDIPMRRLAKRMKKTNSATTNSARKISTRSSTRKKKSTKK
jgi:hypothetical protein